jgi:hypothetical protein
MKDLHSRYSPRIVPDRDHPNLTLSDRRPGRTGGFLTFDSHVPVKTQAQVPKADLHERKLLETSLLINPPPVSAG